MRKEIQYTPVGRVKRRKKNWRRAIKGFVADTAVILVTGMLAGMGFWAGLALASAAGLFPV